MRASYKKRVASFNAPPTRLLLDATVIQCHGSIAHDAVKRVRSAMIEAFTVAAQAEGFNSTWTLEMKSKTAEDFDRLLARRGMALREPESDDAVDPHGG